MGCPVAEVISHAKFQLDWFRGFRAPDGRKSLSPIDLRHHPYNRQLRTTVLHCDVVGQADGRGLPTRYDFAGIFDTSTMVYLCRTMTFLFLYAFSVSIILYLVVFFDAIAFCGE